MIASPPDAAGIVLDPAHGGRLDAGGSPANVARGVGGTLGKDLVLDLCRRTRIRLEARGVPVRLTRDGDVNRTLAQRVATARHPAAGVFVSLHATPAGGRPGLRTWVHRDSRGGCERLARTLHARVGDLLGRDGAAMGRAPLAVLDPGWHAPRTAACLLELPLLVDDRVERRWGTPEAREALADALADALNDWLRSKGVDPPWSEAPTRPGARAVVVGIDDYGALAPGLQLACAQADAVTLAGWLVAACGLDPGRVALLLDAQASAPAVLAALARAAADLDPADELVLVFAGRGAHHEGGPGLVCSDGVVLDGNHVRAAVRPWPGTVHILADAGFAATVSRSGRSCTTGRWRPAGDTGTATVRWLTGAAPGHEAWEHAPAGHGLLTRALVDRARQPGWSITVPALVSALTRDLDVLLPEVGLEGTQRPWSSSGDRRLFLSNDPAPTSSVDVRHWVPLVAQRTGMSCWAAGAAMLVGWRDLADVEGAQVARQADRWAAYERGLAPGDVTALARAWGLVAETRRLHTVDELAELMGSSGPLWIGEADPDLHVVVLYGIVGDGTPDGTEVHIADPWPVGRGERYSLTFRELMSNFHLANELVGFHAQILHSGGRREPPPAQAIPASRVLGAPSSLYARFPDLTSAFSVSDLAIRVRPTPPDAGEALQVAPGPPADPARFRQRGRARVELSAHRWAIVEGLRLGSAMWVRVRSPGGEVRVTVRSSRAHETRLTVGPQAAEVVFRAPSASVWWLALGVEQDAALEVEIWGPTP